MSDLNQNATPTNTTTYDVHQDTGSNKKASRFTPTCKGILIGAVAGSILPVFGTVSGAIIGGIAGKVYEKKCPAKQA